MTEDIKKGFTVICNACGYIGAIPKREDETLENSFYLLGGHRGEGSIICGRCGEAHYDQ